jgi:hypothetical protein
MMASSAVPLFAQDGGRETSSAAGLGLVVLRGDGDDAVAPVNAYTPPVAPSRARAHWRAAAQRANPKLDSARLDQLSQRLARAKDGGGHTSLSLYNIAGSLNDLMHPPEKVSAGIERSTLGRTGSRLPLLTLATNVTAWISICRCADHAPPAARRSSRAARASPRLWRRARTTAGSVGRGTSGTSTGKSICTPVRAWVLLQATRPPCRQRQRQRPTKRQRPPRRRSQTLFAWRGRALPMRQWLLYMAYVLLVVLALTYGVPNYANSVELRGLQFPLSTMGAPCCSSCWIQRAAGDAWQHLAMPEPPLAWPTRTPPTPHPAPLPASPSAPHHTPLTAHPSPPDHTTHTHLSPSHHTSNSNPLAPSPRLPQAPRSSCSCPSGPTAATTGWAAARMQAGSPALLQNPCCRRRRGHQRPCCAPAAAATAAAAAAGARLSMRQACPQPALPIDGRGARLPQLPQLSTPWPLLLLQVVGGQEAVGRHHLEGGCAGGWGGPSIWRGRVPMCGPGVSRCAAAVHRRLE